jgi:hypothetical protein
MNELLCNINWELIIASIAICISILTMFFQRQHNKLSVKPIPTLVKYNYINVLRVRIWNKGTGPLIIKSLIAEKNGVRKDNLRDFLPNLPIGIYYYEYILDFENRAIYPGESINLLEFHKKQEKYYEWFEKIKEILNGISITIKYESVYGDSRTLKLKTLKFGPTTHEEISLNNEQAASMRVMVVQKEGDDTEPKDD